MLQMMHFYSFSIRYMWNKEKTTFSYVGSKCPKKFFSLCTTIHNLPPFILTSNLKFSGLRWEDSKKLQHLSSRIFCPSFRIVKVHESFFFRKREELISLGNICSLGQFIFPILSVAIEVPQNYQSAGHQPHLQDLVSQPWQGESWAASGLVHQQQPHPVPSPIIKRR